MTFARTFLAVFLAVVLCNVFDAEVLWLGGAVRRYGLLPLMRLLMRAAAVGLGVIWRGAGKPPKPERVYPRPRP